MGTSLKTKLERSAAAVGWSEVRKSMRPCIGSVGGMKFEFEDKAGAQRGGRRGVRGEEVNEALHWKCGRCGTAIMEEV